MQDGLKYVDKCRKRVIEINIVKANKKQKIVIYKMSLELINSNLINE